MKKASSIEVKGIGDWIWELHTKNGMTGSAIWQKLQTSGHDEINVNSVYQYLKKRSREETDNLGDTFNKHVKEHLPNDLGALELIESVSLANTKITARTASKKLSRSKEFIEHFQKHWAMPLVEALSDAKALKLLSQEILSKCFDWVSEYVDWLKVHRSEREIALKAIDAKLKYSAVLKGSRGSKINIYKSSPDEKPVPEFKIGGKVVHLRREKSE